jgi:hypothetical protein
MSYITRDRNAIMKLVRSVPLVRKRTRRSKFSRLSDNDAFRITYYNIIYYSTRFYGTELSEYNNTNLLETLFRNRLLNDVVLKRLCLFIKY